MHVIHIKDGLAHVQIDHMVKIDWKSVEVDIDPKYKQRIEAYVRKYAAKSYEKELSELASLLVPLVLFVLINLMGTYGVVALEIEKFPARVMRCFKVSTLILLLTCLVMIVVVHLHHHAKCTENNCSAKQIDIVQSIKLESDALNYICFAIGVIIWVWIFCQYIVPYTAKPFAFVGKIGEDC